MGEKESLIKNLHSFKEQVDKVFPIDVMILFGSRAEGKATKDSDIDLIIVSKKFDKLNFIKRAAKMYDFWSLNYPVDFLCYTPKEFNERKKQITIVKAAIENGIAI